MLIIIAGLLFLHLLAMAVMLLVGHASFRGAGLLLGKFDMDGELTVPAWYAASALLFCSVLALAVYSRTGGPRMQGFRWQWAGLAAVLIFLSVDEMTALHEELSGPLTHATRLDPTYWVKWAWILPYTALAAVVALVFWRFLWQLPRRTRRSFLAAGALFVGAAAGLELAGSRLWTPGVPTLGYLAVSTAEEAIEKLAVVLLAYGLTTHLRDHTAPFTVAFADEPVR